MPERSLIHDYTAEMEEKERMKLEQPNLRNRVRRCGKNGQGYIELLRRQQELHRELHRPLRRQEVKSKVPRSGAVPSTRAVRGQSGGSTHSRAMGGQASGSVPMWLV